MQASMSDNSALAVHTSHSYKTKKLVIIAEVYRANVRLRLYDASKIEILHHKIGLIL